jgi:hypothetical protein
VRDNERRGRTQQRGNRITNLLKFLSLTGVLFGASFFTKDRLSVCIGRGTTMKSTNRRANVAGGGLLMALLLCLNEAEPTDSFVHPFSRSNAVNRASFLSKTTASSRLSSTRRFYSASSFYDRFGEDDDFEEDEEEDYDEMIDPDALGDWRDFRRNLAKSILTGDEENFEEKKTVRTSVSKENAEVLSIQNKALAEEYTNGVWAHEVATVRPETVLFSFVSQISCFSDHQYCAQLHSLA